MTSQNKRAFIEIALALVLFMLALTHVFGLIPYNKSSLDVSLWISRFGFWLALLILYFFTLKIEKSKFFIWTEQKKKPLVYLLSIITIIAVVTIILTIISLAEKKLGMAESNKALNELTAVLCGDKLLLVFTCLTAAFTEELFFRGYILPRLQVLTNNKWITIILCSLFFGLVHFGYSDLNRMLFSFIIGLIFSFYYLKYKSLAILIICHFIMDFYSTFGACN